VTRDRGQATVEFALALPLVALLVLGIVQLVVIARDQLAVELAAREGARAAAVAADPGAAASVAANDAVGLDPLHVAVSEGDGRVTVTVRHRSATDVPLIGLAIGEVEVSASVTMRREPP
jgi:Flp pilus assembly protein TadG